MLDCEDENFTDFENWPYDNMHSEIGVSAFSYGGSICQQYISLTQPYILLVCCGLSREFDSDSIWEI